MYCSSCGGSIAPGLSYCNHCGVKLSVEKSDSLGRSSEVRPAALLWGMMAVLVFGLVAIALLMIAMKIVGLNEGQILAFTLASFLLMMVIEGVFLWQLIIRQRRAEETGDTALPKKQTTKELEAEQAQLLPEAMPSVTEHTTRSFEPVYRERK